MTNSADPDQLASSEDTNSSEDTDSSESTVCKGRKYPAGSAGPGLIN